MTSSGSIATQRDPALQPARTGTRQQSRAATARVRRYIDVLIAHPDERDRLASLPDHRNLRVNSLGPYRDRKSVCLFD